MLEAMLFKAIELSEFGVLNLEADGLDAWNKTKEITEKISEGERLTATEKAYLIKKSQSLIDFITPNLRTFDGKSISVLKALAEKPIHQRYRDGETDEKIEKDLTPRIFPEGKTEKDLRRIIQLQLVSAQDKGEWEQKVAEYLGVGDRMLRHSLNRLGKNYAIRFDKEIGGFVLIG
jgi:hypothetical protein